MKARFASALAAAMLVASCMSKIPMPLDYTEYDLGEPAQQAPAGPEPGKALVVFMLPGLGWTYQKPKTEQLPPSVYRVTADGQELVGFVSEGNKIACQSPPGHQVFMASAAGGARFIDATLAAGRTYYVGVSGGFNGVWESGGYIRPYKTELLQKESFRDFMKSGTALMQVSPKGRAWYDEHRAAINERRREGLARFNARQHKPEEILGADDGE